MDKNVGSGRLCFSVGQKIPQFGFTSGIIQQGSGVKSLKREDEGRAWQPARWMNTTGRGAWYKDPGAPAC